MISINGHKPDRKVQSNPSRNTGQLVSSPRRGFVPMNCLGPTVAGLELDKIPARKRPGKNPKIHKGKQECCPTCNPTGFAAARRRDEREKERR